MSKLSVKILNGLLSLSFDVVEFTLLIDLIFFIFLRKERKLKKGKREGHEYMPLSLIFLIYH